MIGISSACYYPLPTEDAFRFLAESGTKLCEFFFNSPGEISSPFSESVRKAAIDGGFKIDSVHPFSSFAETSFFFSEYERRTLEGVDIYRRYFAGAAELGARYFVFHGATLGHDISPSQYAERFYLLSRAAKEEGICLCQENVSRCLTGRPEYVSALKKLMGDDISFTLDVKQANRVGVDPLEMAKVMGEGLKLVHVNDFDNEHDCLLPCRGSFDLLALKKLLDDIEYEGNYIIEVYRKNYSDFSEINRSYLDLNILFGQIR